MGKSTMELDWLRAEVYTMCEFKCDGYSVPRLLGQKDRVITSLALGFTTLDSIFRGCAQDFALHCKLYGRFKRAVHAP